jgi:ABC-type Mn2+/Zn2+ transport system ATPase subunit
VGHESFGDRARFPTFDRRHCSSRSWVERSDVVSAAAAGAGREQRAPLLSIEKLALRYGARTVLDDVDLDIRPGQFWFVLGPNGAGKSTLLRAILGLITPAAGVLRRHPQLDRAHVGFVPQRCDLNPSVPTTIREFVSLGLVGTGVGRREGRERLASALTTVGLAGMEQRDYWALSGGQRQRALVARALVRRPRLLILDEPSAGLDPSAEANLMELVARLNGEEHLTILFVTHDVELPGRYGTHVALVHGGRVVAGPREEVLGDGGVHHIYTGGHAHDADRGGTSGARRRGAGS